MALDDIISLTINLQTGGVEKTGFGTTLMVEANAGVAGSTRVLTISQADDLLLEGYSSEGAAYKAAAAYFSQKPKPPTMKVGRRLVNSVLCRVVTELAYTSYTHKIDNGSDPTPNKTYTTGSSTTKAAIATAICALIEADYPGTTTDYGDGTYLVATTGTLASSVDGLNIKQNVVLSVHIVSYDAGCTYAHKINNTVFTSLAAGSVNAVAAAMIVAINAGDEPVVALADPGLDLSKYIVISETDMSSFRSEVYCVGYTDSDPYILQSYPGISESWSTALTAIYNEDSDWYFVGCPDRNIDQQVDIAAWIEQKSKVYGYSSDDSNIVDVAVASDTTSTPAQLAALSYARTFGAYHSVDTGDGATDEFMDFAWMGQMATFDPDIETATWAFKTLVGVSADNLTPTQRTNTLGNLLTGAGGKNVSVYVTEGGEDVTLGAKVAAGEWIDIITGRDWLHARIQESIWAVLTQNQKVAFTDKGISLIASQIEIWFKKGFQTEYLFEDLATYGVPGYSMTIPSRASLGANDVAHRVLKGIVGNASVAGAIHVTQLTVNLSV